MSEPARPMRLSIHKALWGMEAIGSLDEQLRRVRAAGYDGVEINVSGGVPAELGELLARHELEWCAQLIFERAEDLEAAMAACAPLRPTLFNVHGGRDRFSFDEGCAFFERALAAERRFGIPVGHETHRHRLLYSPFVAHAYLERFPDLRLTADFSHWTCVCEYLLGDLDEIMELALSRAIHIHCRVGHEEGPQVADPRAPEFEHYRHTFQGWWDRIRAHCEREGRESLVAVPEYGPPGYLQTLPYTRQPVADLWDICLWQANDLRERWGLPVRLT